MGKLFFFINHLWVTSISKYLNKKYNSKIKRTGNAIRFIGISRVTGLENIEVGNNVHIAENAFISGKGGLTIGDNVHISRNLVLYTNNHNYEGECLPYDTTYRFKKVIIEKNVWIGMNVTILPGAHIQEGVIIGAGAVVAGKINKFDIIGSPIATQLKSRNIEHYDRLENEGKYGGPSGTPLKNINQ